MDWRIAMTYITENLIPGEKVVFVTRLHPIVFLTPSILSFLALAFMIPSHVRGLGQILAPIAAVVWVMQIARYFRSEFGVTSRRVLIKTGFLTVDSHEILLAKVEGIAVHQGILARALGCGSIVITGTGGTAQRLDAIDAPFEFRKEVQQQIELLGGQAGGADGGESHKQREG